MHKTTTVEGLYCQSRIMSKKNKKIPLKEPAEVRVVRLVRFTVVHCNSQYGLGFFCLLKPPKRSVPVVNASVQHNPDWLPDNLLTIL